MLPGFRNRDARKLGVGHGGGRLPADERLTAETTLVPVGIARVDTIELTAQLNDLRGRVQASADAALSAMVVAADEVAAQLDRHQSDAEQREDQLRRAREAAAASLHRFELLLHLIHEFVGRSDTQEAADSAGPQAARRRWFGRERRRAPVPPACLVLAAPQTLLAQEASSWPLRGDQQRRPPPCADETINASDLAGGERHGLDNDASMPPIQAPHDVDIAVHLLGTFRLALDGHAVDIINGGKSLRVLKYLLSHRDRPVPKEVLIDLFWPESDVDHVNRSLHQAVYTLRKMLRTGVDEAQHVVFESGAYLINPKLSVWCDLDVFELSSVAGRAAEMDGRMVDAITALSCAERCYEGDYLAESPYEEWAIGERERLRLQYVDVANRLAGLLFDAGDLDAAVAVSQRLLRHEPCDDAAHRRLIHCYGLTGQRNLVIRQYRAYVACAERLYGLGPLPETTALYRSLIADG